MTAKNASIFAGNIREIANIWTTIVRLRITLRIYESTADKINGAIKVVSITPFETATAEFKLGATYPANFYRGSAPLICNPYCTDI
jgi:hypothetical protein